MKYRDETGQWKELYLSPTGDTLPIGTVVDYDGHVVPYGYEKVDDPNVYSTEEQKIGTYLGKPLYRKVIVVTDGSITEVDISSLNVDHIMYDKSTIDFYTNDIHFTRHEFNNGGTESFILFKRNNTMQIRISNIKITTFNKIELVLEYTKRTD